jgi:putative oxidoreductase
MSATNPVSDLRDPDDVLGRSRYHAVERRDSFFHRLVATDDSWAPALARLTLGLVMLPHGAQKVFGWFGGHGIEGTMGFFASLGIPSLFAAAFVFVELVASIMLLVGAFTRLASIGIIGMMIGAVGFVHAPHGFFMNWYGMQKGEGFEYHLLAIGLALVCLVAGGGRASVDRSLTTRRSAEGGGVGPELSANP